MDNAMEEKKGTVKLFSKMNAYEQLLTKEQRTAAYEFTSSRKS